MTNARTLFCAAAVVAATAAITSAVTSHPIISVVIAAFFMPRVPAEGAIAAILFHLPAYALVTFVWDTGVHFIHLYAILFAIEIGIMWGVGWLRPRTPTPTTHRAPVDMTPWRWSKWISGLLAASVVAIYWLFSPLGVGVT